MKKIAFSGTLDPITNGHMWVIGEARALASEVVVFISENPAKKPQFSAEKRKAIVEQSVAECGWNNVSIIIVRSDYTARVAKRHGIEYLIRGIRNTADFDYENLIQQTNVDVLQGAKTLFVMPPRDLGSVSSNFVRGLQGPVGWHWTMQKFVPRPAYAAWIMDWLRKEWESLWHYHRADVHATANANRWFDYLVGEQAYGSPLRPYHNLDHLVHGLSEIAVWAANTGAASIDVDTLKKAFWFHDAIHDSRPHALSNEERSARLWLDAGLEPLDADGPAHLIRATDHLQQNVIDHPLKDAMLSVDLAILGQPEDIYAGYAHAIRAEYSGIAESVYRAGRQRILALFQARLQADQLYPDGFFSAHYRHSASDNIAWEIAMLDKPA